MVPTRGETTLYDQNFASGSAGFFSQTLSSCPQYDEYLADDFKVPAGHTWKIKEVDVTGFYYEGRVGPASSVNVLFWKDKRRRGGRLPKTRPKVECDNLRPAAGLHSGSFQMRLPASCVVKLKGGDSGATFWVTVQANMKGPNSSGLWAWQSNATVANNVAAGWWYGWPPPPCSDAWHRVTKCTGVTFDLAFALLGKERPLTKWLSGAHPDPSATKNRRVTNEKFEN